MYDYDSLVELIYAAVEDPAHWTPFLDAFVGALHGRLGALWIALRDAPERPGFWVSVGTPAEVLAGIKDPDYRDPWTSHLDVASQPVGKIIRSNEIRSDEDLVQDPWYQRICVPHDYHYGGGVLLAQSGAMSAGMTMNRSRSLGPLTDDEIAQWRRLLPHLMRAVAMIGRQATLINERDAMMRYFDDLGQGVVLATPMCRVLIANTRAKSILADACRVRLHDGLLEAVEPESHRRLTEAVKRTGDTAAEPARIAIAGADGTPLLLTVLPIVHPDDSRFAIEVPTALIYFADTGASFEFDPGPLLELFGLTNAEARLACLLAAGHTLATASEILYVSLNTVRTHLQRALAKAGLHRQAELVALTLNVSNPRAPAQNHLNG
jgi:DNA-binding CsgD family transcriptional regulator